MAHSTPAAQRLIETRMRDALKGDPGACFDLGIALTSGKCSRDNLVEAHKWFTLAALGGYDSAAKSGAKIARTMSPAELAEAGRRTRLVQKCDARQILRFSEWMFS